MPKNVELLSPAGSPESLRAAVNAGCDAVYLGGKSFSARSFAGNFSRDELRDALDYCHLRGVRVYVAVNTLYKENEIEPLYDFINEAYADGADAFIVADLGAARLIRERFPDVAIHASTQMTAHSAGDVRFLRGAGFDRVVLSRELSVAEIGGVMRENSQNTDRRGGLRPAELELFVHGALCVCYSGQCLMSGMIGGRSGNRGKCAQSCRMRYELINRADSETVKDGYLLSPRDLMALELLPGVVAEAERYGVRLSLKIEGRMKSPEYVSIVTRAYRERLDSIAAADSGTPNPDTIKRVTQIFNRGGAFTDGYFKSYSSPEMMSTQTPKSTGVLAGTVLSYETKTGLCTIKAREDFVPGDGIEIWTQTEPHCGVGINKTIFATEKFIVNVKGDVHPGDLVYKSYDKALDDDAKRLLKEEGRQLTVSAALRARIGEPLRLTLMYDGLRNVAVSHTEEGAVVQTAQKTPVAHENLRSVIAQTGGTPFALEFTSFEADENIFVPLTEIKNLRRNALTEFERLIIDGLRREPSPSAQDAKRSKRTAGSAASRLSGRSKLITVQVKTFAQFEAALVPGVNRIYMEYGTRSGELFSEYQKRCHDIGIELYAALPRIDRDLPVRAVTASTSSTRSVTAANTDSQYVPDISADGILVRTFAQLRTFAGTDKPLVTDYSFNIYNNLSAAFLTGLGVETITLSPELSLNEINTVALPNSEVIIYGRLPLMTTAACPVGLYAADKKPSRFCSMKDTANFLYALRDRKDAIFPIETDCEICTAYILNSNPIFTLNKDNNILNARFAYGRLVFTDETPEDINRLTRAHVAMLSDTDSDAAISDAMSSDEVSGVIAEQLAAGVTNGYFYRGVE